MNPKFTNKKEIGNFIYNLWFCLPVGIEGENRRRGRGRLGRGRQGLGRRERAGPGGHKVVPVVGDETAEGNRKDSLSFGK